MDLDFLENPGMGVNLWIKCGGLRGGVHLKY
jgi:hypothetical protein